MIQILLLFISLSMAETKELYTVRPNPLPPSPIPTVEPLPPPPIPPIDCGNMESIYPTGVCEYKKVVWSSSDKTSGKCEKSQWGTFVVTCNFNVSATCTSGTFTFDSSEDQKFCIDKIKMPATCFEPKEKIDRTYKSEFLVSEEDCKDLVKNTALCSDVSSNMDRAGFWLRVFPEMAGLKCGKHTQRGQISCCPRPENPPQEMPKN